MNPPNDIRTSDAFPQTPRTPYLAMKRVLRLAHKELREILRDRRTILTLVAMPLLLYPLMSVTFQQFYLASRVGMESGTKYFVGVLSSAEWTAFKRRYQAGQEAWQASHPEPVGTPQTGKRGTLAEIVPVSPESMDGGMDRLAGLEQLKESLRAGKIDMVVVIPNLDERDLDQDPPEKDRQFPMQIYAMPNSGAALTALTHIETAFAAINQENLKSRLDLPDAMPRINLLSVERVFLEAPPADKVVSLAALVPLILILMTITGAVYPAIDLTAGERERNTLEILVAAPVPRFELLTAKYISVLTVAVLTALVNLGCMTVTLSWSGMGSVLFGGQGLSAVLLIHLLGLLLLFAAFFSAVLLCLTSFARSFKEAQAYLIPLMLASLTPGILAMLPGLELSPMLSALPLVNVVLMARDLFGEGVEPVNATIVIVTTLLYALAALSLAARVFGAESVLYSEQSSWADLLRRPEQAQPAASISAMLWCLAMMVPVHFSLSALVRALGPSPGQGVVLIVIVNLLLFGLLPWLFVYLGRVDPRCGLGMHTAQPTALLAGLLLGASLWPIQLWMLAQSGSQKMLEERFGALLESFKQAFENVGWGVLAVVIVPAILEEAFFRGLLFNALKRRTGALVTIAASALLFALTHVVLGGALGLERLLPSLALGLILGSVCWASGSLWPGMVLHVAHNSILIAVGINASGSTHEVPWQWLAGGGVGTLIGAGLVGRLIVLERQKQAPG